MWLTHIDKYSFDRIWKIKCEIVVAWTLMSVPDHLICMEMYFWGKHSSSLFQNHNYRSLSIIQHYEMPPVKGSTVEFKYSALLYLFLNQHPHVLCIPFCLVHKPRILSVRRVRYRYNMRSQHTQALWVSVRLWPTPPQQPPTETTGKRNINSDGLRVVFVCGTVVRSDVVVLSKHNYRICDKTATSSIIVLITRKHVHWNKITRTLPHRPILFHCCKRAHKSRVLYNIVPRKPHKRNQQPIESVSAKILLSGRLIRFWSFDFVLTDIRMLDDLKYKKGKLVRN